MFEERLAEGLYLRPLEVRYADEFATHLDRAREHIRPWVGSSFVTDTAEGARATLQRYANTTAQDGARIYGLWRAETLVGGVMFATFDAARNTCEIGCWLEPGMEGRGIITTAVCLLLEWAFEERGIVRAEWHCRSDNAKSAAIAKRLGMTSEGVLRSSWKFDGDRFDTEIFSLLRSEWPGRTEARSRAARGAR